MDKREFWTKGQPLNFIARAIGKTFILPLRYGRGNDYDAESYWRDRLKSYGTSLKGCGDEGLSEAENAERHRQLAKLITQILQKNAIDFSRLSCLDVGCGNGYFARILASLGVGHYLGIDITDTLFHKLRQRFPTYHFQKLDITNGKLSSKFDLILMLDVIEHVTTYDKLVLALENIKKSLKPEGLLFINAVFPKSQKKFFYLHKWSEREIRPLFAGWPIAVYHLPERDDSLWLLRLPLGRVVRSRRKGVG